MVTMKSGTKTIISALILLVQSVILVVGITGCRANKVFEGHQTLNIWPGVAPGSEDWTIDEVAGFNSVTDVKTPSITVFRPNPALANGSVFVVCPGGGFQGLSVIKEGSMVAEWLADRGVTGIVLKYRVRRDLDLPPSEAGDSFDQRIRALDAGRKLATADALQTMRYLREHASELNIDPDRIGMIGFSAGAMTTMSAVVEGGNEEMPDLAASVYGAMPGDVAPEGAPPLFIVHAKDDDVVPVERSLKMQAAWDRAGLPVAMQIYEEGGHGFGAKPYGKSSDDWMNEFESWLIDQGWISALKVENTQ